MGPDKRTLDAAEQAAAGEGGARGYGDETSLQGQLDSERRKRQLLEQRLQELTAENRQTRRQAEQAERHSQVQGALQELGVHKVHLAFRLVRDEVYRGEDGELYGNADGTPVPYREYLRKFVAENPEFLPPRIAGGSGATGGRQEMSSGFDMERIRPGMSQEELAQAWKEVARLAGTGSSGW